MRIYTSNDFAAYTNAISGADGKNVEGHRYDFVNGNRLTVLEFQQGPIKEVGHNGVTNEQLLAALIHRTEYLNNQFPCEENLAALDGMRAALAAFQHRTATRLARGVEGFNVA